MRVVIQRVKHASVEVDGNIVGKCGHGYLLLVGITHEDNENIVKKIAAKDTVSFERMIPPMTPQIRIAAVRRTMIPEMIN